MVISYFFDPGIELEEHIFKIQLICPGGQSNGTSTSTIIICVTNQLWLIYMCIYSYVKTALKSKRGTH